MIKRFALVCLIVTFLGAPVVARERLSLSGEWEFRVDPNDAGRTENWFADGVHFDRSIKVPGAWNAQGVGEPSRALYSSYTGAAWYRKHITIPENWRHKAVWLNFGGVHRSADVWVNGELVGSHVGYVTPFRFEITRYVVKKWTADVVVRVDSRRRPDIDPLYGCMDVMDMPGVEWGGIFRDVWIEPIDTSWIESVFVRPHIDGGVAEVIVETNSHIMYGGSPEQPPEFHAEADIYDQAGRLVGSGRTAPLLPSLDAAYTMVKIDGMKLWSPKRPYLYRVDVRLYQEGKLLDTVSERFGMRDITRDGSRFLLNGRPIFLRGYGDDCVFPNTIAPPADKNEYYARLKAAKDYGFNYVRHHSWVPLPEYLDVADELGIMVQPEFPIAYSEFFNDKTAELRQFYKDQWDAVIKANRNHPSIITWSMANEMWGGFDLAQSMYLSAKKLDPTRLVIDSDGIGVPGPGDKTRATLDFLACQFDEIGKFGFYDGKYDLGKWKPEKPVLIHEMGNFGTFPDLAQERLFASGVRPYWLIDANALAEKNGLDASQLAVWKSDSDRLQATALKTNIEAARRSPGISGYDQWLLQDYWTGSNGVLDMFYRQKSLSATEFRKLNAPTVLLMDSPKRSYRLGETAKVTLLVSRYEDAPSSKAKLTWKLLDSGKTERSGAVVGLKVRADGVQKLSEITIKMPASGAARKLTLSVELTDENGKASNSWDIWVFPAARPVVSNRVCVMGLAPVRKLYPKALEAATDQAVPRCDLLITSKLTSAGLDYLASGGRVLLLGRWKSLPAARTKYKPCWWLGGQGDSNLGTVINTNHPSLRGMPRQGWCGLDYYELLNGATAAVLDDLPRIEPIIGGIDLPRMLRRKAYLFEATVDRGKLLVSGLNFQRALANGDPAAECLLDSLVGYAVGPAFAPKAAISGDSLRKSIASAAPATGRLVDGFARVISSTAPKMEYANYREFSSPCWIVRQSDGLQRVEWETAPVLAGEGRVVFAWTAGLGFVSQPSGKFGLWLDGKRLIDFDVSLSAKSWRSEDDRIELIFDPEDVNSEDASGVMYLAVPKEALRAGQPARLAVTGSKSDSKRWFMLYDFRDTIEREN